jgi:hypothetical protein
MIRFIGLTEASKRLIRHRERSKHRAHDVTFGQRASCCGTNCSSLSPNRHDILKLCNGCQFVLLDPEILTESGNELLPFFLLSKFFSLHSRFWICEHKGKADSNVPFAIMTPVSLPLSSIAPMEPGMSLSTINVLRSVSRLRCDSPP